MLKFCCWLGKVAGNREVMEVSLGLRLLWLVSGLEGEELAEPVDPPEPADPWGLPDDLTAGSIPMPLAGLQIGLGPDEEEERPVDEKVG